MEIETPYWDMEENDRRLKWKPNPKLYPNGRCKCPKRALLRRLVAKVKPLIDKYDAEWEATGQSYEGRNYGGVRDHFVTGKRVVFLMGREDPEAPLYATEGVMFMRCSVYDWHYLMQRVEYQREKLWIQAGIDMNNVPFDLQCLVGPGLRDYDEYLKGIAPSHCVHGECEMNGCGHRRGHAKFAEYVCNVSLETSFACAFTADVEYPSSDSEVEIADEKDVFDYVINYPSSDEADVLSQPLVTSSSDASQPSEVSYVSMGANIPAADRYVAPEVDTMHELLDMQLLYNENRRRAQASNNFIGDEAEYSSLQLWEVEQIALNEKVALQETAIREASRLDADVSSLTEMSADAILTSSACEGSYPDTLPPCSKPSAQATGGNHII
jgi:hypothetical protein